MALGLLNLEGQAVGLWTVESLPEIVVHNDLMVDVKVKVAAFVQMICAAAAAKLLSGNDVAEEYVTFVAKTVCLSVSYMKGKAMEACLEIQMTTMAD